MVGVFACLRASRSFVHLRSSCSKRFALRTLRAPGASTRSLGRQLTLTQDSRASRQPARFGDLAQHTVELVAAALQNEDTVLWSFVEREQAYRVEHPGGEAHTTDAELLAVLDAQP